MEPEVRQQLLERFEEAIADVYTYGDLFHRGRAIGMREILWGLGLREEAAEIERRFSDRTMPDPPQPPAQAQAQSQRGPEGMSATEEFFDRAIRRPVKMNPIMEWFLHGNKRR